MNDRITLNSREQQRGQVLGWLVKGRVTRAEAQQVLGVSGRHLYRLERRFTDLGPAALAHGNRGRPSLTRVGEAPRATIVAIAQSRAYRGYNHTHLAEALAEEHGIVVSRHTLRRILQPAGMRSPRRRRPRKHRARRVRAAQRGLLVQVDASDHDWLEGRGPRLTLVGAIDDATGELLAAHFCPRESSAAYLRLLRDSVRAHGVPAAWYSDRHSCFTRNDKEPWTLAEQLANRPTQVARALAQLGVQLILARSPQAKGRIERCWGTLQDRLVKALRRARAGSIDEANATLGAYLPSHNARFAVAPVDRADAHHRLPRSLDLAGVCSFHYVRTVANDNTVRLEERLVQIPPGPRRRSYARCKVELQERLDGELVVLYKDDVIARAAAAPGAVLAARGRKRGRELLADSPAPRPVPEPIPDIDLPGDLFLQPREHPWRRDLMLRRKDQKKGPQRQRAEAPLSIPSKECAILPNDHQMTESLLT